ncbi:hypothetical protein ACJX0J_039940 [Zea mays]
MSMYTQFEILWQRKHKTWIGNEDGEVALFIEESQMKGDLSLQTCLTLNPSDIKDQVEMILTNHKDLPDKFKEEYAFGYLYIEWTRMSYNMGMPLIYLVDGLLTKVDDMNIGNIFIE